MTPDGRWNPPELWPESTPPLPGWERGADGRWFDPNKSEGGDVIDLRSGLVDLERPAAREDVAERALAEAQNSARRARREVSGAPARPPLDGEASSHNANPVPQVDQPYTQRNVERSAREPKSLNDPEQTLAEAATAQPPSLRLEFAEYQPVPVDTGRSPTSQGLILFVAAAISAIVAGLVVVLLLL